jgi:sugar phosphate permease
VRKQRRGRASSGSASPARALKKLPATASMRPVGSTRWNMVALCFGVRTVGQANRILLGAIMPTMAAELGFSTVDKGKLLGAFASGYGLTQILGGAAADRVGSKFILLVALLAVSLGSIAATFLGTSDSINALWACYFLMGLLEGPSFPAVGSMLGQWIPKTEKGRAASAADTGGSIGGLLALGAGPVLAASFGWRFALRTFGGTSLAFCGLWLAFSSDRPITCDWIADDEMRYLRACGVVAPISKTKKVEAGAPTFPYELFGNAPVLAVCYAHVIFNFARYIVYGWIPTYYIEVLGVSCECHRVAMMHIAVPVVVVFFRLIFVYASFCMQLPLPEHV